MHSRGNGDLLCRSRRVPSRPGVEAVVRLSAALGSHFGQRFFDLGIVHHLRIDFFDQGNWTPNASGLFARRWGGRIHDFPHCRSANEAAVEEELIRNRRALCP